MRVAMNHLRELIDRFDTEGKLSEFRSWAQGRSGNDRDAWEQCPAGDWMLWLAASVGVERKSVVRAAVQCVAIGLDFIPKADASLRTFLDACDRWLLGAQNRQELRSVADDLYEQICSKNSGLNRAQTNLFDACVWIGNLVLDDPLDVDEDEGNGSQVISEREAMGAYGMSAYMAITRISTAYACGETGGEASDPRWQQSFQKAREMCARLVGAVILFEHVQRAATNAGITLTS
jgi:hypothetical protein